jgi:hypothetical protein
MKNTSGPLDLLEKLGRSGTADQDDRACSNEDEEDHHAKGLPTRPLGRPDREVLEHAGLPEHADDDHHAEKQEDDVPVDTGL